MAIPFDYVMAMVRNDSQVEADPGSWMPSNYPKTKAWLSSQGDR